MCQHQAILYKGLEHRGFGYPGHPGTNPLRPLMDDYQYVHPHCMWTEPAETQFHSVFKDESTFVFGSSLYSDVKASLKSQRILFHVLSVPEPRAEQVQPVHRAQSRCEFNGLVSSHMHCRAAGRPHPKVQHHSPPSHKRRESATAGFPELPLGRRSEMLILCNNLVFSYLLIWQKVKPSPLHIFVKRF